MTRFVTLTDSEDHGQGNSPLILDAERVVSLHEFDRRHGEAGTRVVLSIGDGTTSYYVQETIYNAAAIIRGSQGDDADEGGR